MFKINFFCKFDHQFQHYFMRPTIFIYISAILLSIRVISANYNNPLGSRSAGMGNTTVVLSDLWSVNNNQAGLAVFNHTAAGVYYENRFLVKELSLKSFCFAIPTHSGNFGVSFNSFGYSGYNQLKAGLAYGRKFSKVFSAGVQLDYLRTHIAENYGNQDAFTFEVGIRTELTKQVTLAAHVFNPIRVKIQSETNDRVPAVFKLAIAYQVSEKLLVAVETEKNSDFKPLIRGGMEYRIIDKAALRIGYSTLPSTSGSDNFSIASVFSFGFGLNIRKLILDLSSSYHQTLGWSPTVSFIYIFK
jgi:hypothetical protein